MKPKIKKRYDSLIKKISRKRKVRVIFYIFELSKWKCESLYQELLKDKLFTPVIVLGVTSGRARTLSYEIKEKKLKEIENFFARRSIKVEYAYDLKKEKHISLKKFKPDIVFYQQQVGNCLLNSVQTVSKYALTCYIPYYVPNYCNLHYDYDLFVQNCFKFYVLNNSLKKYYLSDKEANHIDNIVVTGHPALDYLHENVKSGKKWVIYAPHFSIMHPLIKNKFYYSTFNYNCNLILEYAQKHPEISWVFKPHPNLKESLRKMNISEDLIEDYYNQWRKVGVVNEDCMYTDLFRNSKALITDCGSFTTEYFYTGKPLIHLIHPISINWPPIVMKSMFDSFYKVRDNTELIDTLNRVIVEEDDSRYQEREKALEKMGHIEFSASKIIDDLKKSIFTDYSERKNIVSTFIKRIKNVKK